MFGIPPFRQVSLLVPRRKLYFVDLLIESIVPLRIYHGGLTEKISSCALY